MSLQRTAGDLFETLLQIASAIPREQKNTLRTALRLKPEF